MPTITVTIERSDRRGMECMVMNSSEWERQRSVVFFPLDVANKLCQLHYKAPGHFIFAHNEREKVAMEGFGVVEVDLGALNSEWAGCVASLVCG